jgi:hypothetical protein
MLKKLPVLLKFNSADECTLHLGGNISRPFIEMETAFYIILNIRTPKGFESFARFYIGNRKESARRVFDKLVGTEEAIDSCILQMDLMETKNNLPVNIKVIGCTLEEMAENCKVITKEAFKLLILESS